MMTLIMLLCSGLGTEALATDYYYVINIDRSGSMGSAVTAIYPDCPNATSRLEVARCMAKKHVQSIRSGPNKHYAVMYFDSNGLIVVQPFTTNKTLIYNAIDAVPGPGDYTPLADAMCKGLTDLNAEAGEDDGKYLFTYTDGFENDSRGGQGECDVCDGLIGRWESDCDLDNAVTCNPWQLCLKDVFADPDKGAHLFYYFGDPIRKDQYDLLPPHVQKDIDLNAQGAKADYVFWQQVVDSSGGDFAYVSDNDSTIPEVPPQVQDPDNQDPTRVPGLRLWGIMALIGIMVTATAIVVRRKTGSIRS